MDSKINHDSEGDKPMAKEITEADVLRVMDEMKKAKDRAKWASALAAAATKHFAKERQAALDLEKIEVLKTMLATSIEHTEWVVGDVRHESGNLQFGNVNVRITIDTSRAVD